MSLESIQQRAEALTLRAALALPERVQRVLAGKPVVLDGQTLAPETQLMLRLQRVARMPDVWRLPLDEGRRLFDRQTSAIGGTPPIGSVLDLEVEGMRARLYTPRSAPAGPTPLLLFFHGGGFVYGGLASHDPSCRVLAEEGRLRVLAIDYRLAPEHPFPAAHEDAVAALRWTLKNAESLGADPARVAVGGDSAGGNLSAGVAIVAAREGLPLAHQLLVYPATDNARATRSLEMFSVGFYLEHGFMDLASNSYLPDVATRLDPRASPLHDDVPEGLAPASVVTAGYDPLRDEGEAYARKLSEAGVAVDLRRYPDQIHGFLNMTGVGRRSPAAVREIGRRLGATLRG